MKFKHRKSFFLEGEIKQFRHLLSFNTRFPLAYRVNRQLRVPNACEVVVDPKSQNHANLENSRELNDVVIKTGKQIDGMTNWNEILYKRGQ